MTWMKRMACRTSPTMMRTMQLSMEPKAMIVMSKRCALAVAAGSGSGSGEGGGGGSGGGSSGGSAAAVDGCGGAAALPVESWVSRAARSAAQGAEARRMAATLGDGVEVRPSEAAGV